MVGSAVIMKARWGRYECVISVEDSEHPKISNNFHMAVVLTPETVLIISFIQSEDPVYDIQSLLGCIKSTQEWTSSW
jgi:hypothetical protein